MNLFGLVLTVILFFIFKHFNLKIPIIISVGVSIILILKIFNIDYAKYNESANILSFLIAPATIALAYPMYKNYHILLTNKRALYPSLFLATIIAIISTYFCAKFFGADFKVIISMLPKSTTMPIALEISKLIEGYSELTAVVVALTGVFGGAFGHKILKLLKIKNDISIGLALGSASHVIGTAACADRKKDKQTAASTIALIIVGLLSTIIIPLLKNYY
ncbi:MAG: LrgB family protein [Candidatus Gastranaerophilales bacterium]|nr:LrgB family protein [Candidatus Gastranaerophilales bacterium]